jgi:hypothetical protein
MTLERFKKEADVQEIGRGEDCTMKEVLCTAYRQVLYETLFKFEHWHKASNKYLIDVVEVSRKKFINRLKEIK